MPGEQVKIYPGSEAEACLPGYRSALYANALSDFGRPFHLPRSGGWLLARKIGETGYYDAASPYPLTCCSDWSALSRDLDEIDSSIVSVTMVPDPLCELSGADLRKIFDVVNPHTKHMVIDTSKPLEISKSHLQNARRALRKVTVDLCPKPVDYLDDWVALYEVLIRKHGITGQRVFSRESFAEQLSVPGMVMFRASVEGRTVGLDLWYQDGASAQGHLTAFSDDGYKLGASYATKLSLIEYFKNKVRWINLGGLPGEDPTKTNGLRHFKTGWANAERPAYICGRIIDKSTYEHLSNGKRSSSYFPAYRDGEY